MVERLAPSAPARLSLQSIDSSVTAAPGHLASCANEATAV